MKIIQLILWVAFDVLMLTGGAGISFQRAIKNAYLSLSGKFRFAEHVKKLTDEGMPRADAIKFVTVKCRCAGLNAISYSAIMFVFIYISFDVVFRHIL